MPDLFETLYMWSPWHGLKIPELSFHFPQQSRFCTLTLYCTSCAVWRASLSKSDFLDALSTLVKLTCGFFDGPDLEDKAVWACISVGQVASNLEAFVIWTGLPTSLLWSQTSCQLQQQKLKAIEHGKCIILYLMWPLDTSVTPVVCLPLLFLLNFVRFVQCISTAFVIQFSCSISSQSACSLFITVNCTPPVNRYLLLLLAHGGWLLRMGSTQNRVWKKSADFMCIQKKVYFCTFCWLKREPIFSDLLLWIEVVCLWCRNSRMASWQSLSPERIETV